jgi:uncharacterized protein YdeI (YjbR/CyaY-like superfamily)
MPEPIFFDSPHEFREWLADEGATTAECWVGCYKVSARQRGIQRHEAYEEALCHGWVLHKTITLDADSYAMCFCPRKNMASWGKASLELALRLREEGRMTPAGLQALAQADIESTESKAIARATSALDPEQTATLQANPDAWAFWEAQAPGYRHICAYWLQQAKRADTRAARLEKLVAACAAGEKIPAVLPAKKGKG